MDPLENLSAGDFLTFIGLCIATFGFLALYLSVPKNFLENLAKLCYKWPETKNNKLLKFFFSLDLITAWILIFMIFSILSSILLLASKLHLALFKFPYTKYGWVFLTGGYTSVMFFIFIRIIIGKLRKEWEKKSRIRWSLFCLILMLLHSICSILCLPPFSDPPKLNYFFVWLLVMIPILFILFVIVLTYNPLTELARYWNLLEDKEKVDKNKKEKEIIERE